MTRPGEPPAKNGCGALGEYGRHAHVACVHSASSCAVRLANYRAETWLHEHSGDCPAWAAGLICGNPNTHTKWHGGTPCARWPPTGLGSCESG